MLNDTKHTEEKADILNLLATGICPRCNRTISGVKDTPVIAQNILRVVAMHMSKLESSNSKRRIVI